MSMEAQFYEARRRQSAIDRRQSFQTQYEINQHPSQQPSYQNMQIPVRLIQPQLNQGRCTCIPVHRTKLLNSSQSLYTRNRDIYPRPAPLSRHFRRPVQSAVLHKRFSSIEYMQQW